MALKASADFLRNKNDYLESEVERRMREVMTIQDVTILAMASLAETRDSDTGNHIRRTQFYVRALAQDLQSHPRFAAFLTTANIARLFKSAPCTTSARWASPTAFCSNRGALRLRSSRS